MARIAAIFCRFRDDPAAAHPAGLWAAGRIPLELRQRDHRDGVIHALGICSGLIGAVIIIVIASHSTKIVTITSVLIYAAGLVAMLLSCGGTLRPNFCFCSEMVRTGPMRRFFFQVKDGSTFNDEDGENLPSIEAARAHAARIANELAQEGALGAWRSK